jgi:hypothetical protein
LRCAAAESTRSHSGSSFSGIVRSSLFLENIPQPEMVSLGIGVVHMRKANATNACENRRIGQSRIPELFPFAAIAARNDIVDCR